MEAMVCLFYGVMSLDNSSGRGSINMALSSAGALEDPVSQLKNGWHISQPKGVIQWGPRNHLIMKSFGY